MMTIPNLQARRHLIALSGLGGGGGPLRRPRLLQTVHELGFVQVDSVNVLARAHHHILFSRGSGYRRADLAALVEKERSLFENWTHDASIIPAQFFPFWKHRFAREKARLRQRWKRHFGTEHFDDDIARVIDRIARDGPVMARDFEGEKPSSGWWDWHPSKAALEYLWRTGELAITRREGFQKVYDLATRGEIARFWDLLRPDEVDGWITKNRAELVPVQVETASAAPRPALSLPGAAEAAVIAPAPPDRVRILSPFDPLMRDRARIERLFGFSYRIEIFVPEAKRQYGYYVYPVLRGARVAGRIDVKAMRDADTLRVAAFWPEAGVRPSRAFLTRLEAELERLRRFAGVVNVTFADGWLRG
jgi:uncharacterized protein YcaQ